MEGMFESLQSPFLLPNTALQAAKKTLQPLFTTSKTREMRTTQELESRVVLYDLMNHGEQSFAPEFRNLNDEVPEQHWFAIIRRYVSVIGLSFRGLRSASLFCT
jgi:hypothetical protein